MKKHTLTLDDDFASESPLLDDIALLFFRTDTPNYLFADDLNHLYRLALARVDDVTLPHRLPIPLYTFHNSLQYLDYYLVELPELLNQSNNSATTQSKILIIRGEDTDNTVKEILRDFNEPPAEATPLNPDLQLRNDILLAYQQALTPVTLYAPLPLGRSAKAAKERQELDTLLTSIIDYLDLHHL